MHEINLYPAIEKFLTSNKKCSLEYVGTELSQRKKDETFFLRRTPLPHQNGNACNSKDSRGLRMMHAPNGLRLRP